ncbi:Uncharacterised protein [uncultured archaeon]|nr:Uncharacterised protein [uncultured archaeon]
MNKLKLEFYLPQGNWPEAAEIEVLLEQVKNTLHIDYEKSIIDEKKEQDLKRDLLWSLSVFNRIKIKQSRKGKSLYPLLLVSSDSKEITFYPQERVKEEITIQDFLRGLLNGEVKCLHDISKEFVGIFD